MSVLGPITADVVGLCGVGEHFSAGATHVCLQPVHADGDFAARDRMLTALADT